MIYTELQIQLDLNHDSHVNVLKNANTCKEMDVGYLFVDQENGQCYLFDENGNLDDLSKIKTIDSWAFYKCTSLKSIIIPSSIKSIGYCAFYICTALKSVKIPNSVEWIGESAFYTCTSLKSIEIPDSVKRIGGCAFDCCMSLTKINISNNVEYIGEWAFGECVSLKEVLFKGKTIDEVKAMDNYPWEIKDTSIIKCI